MTKCSHAWKEVQRTFNPGVPGDVKGSADPVRKLIFGFTNIELVCEWCGDTKVVEAMGKLEGV